MNSVNRCHFGGPSQLDNSPKERAGQNVVRGESAPSKRHLNPWEFMADSDSAASSHERTYGSCELDRSPRWKRACLGFRDVGSVNPPYRSSSIAAFGLERFRGKRSWENAFMANANA